MEALENIVQFAGGFGMFLYGMNVMADGLQKSVGDKMKNLLALLTGRRILGVLVGALITAIIQSSSATTVMVVGFVNAGIMNLSQAVGVIMGANIGTTITSWLVSMKEWGGLFKPEFFAPAFIGIGAFGLLVVKNQKKKDLCGIMIGFGLLFVGLSLMSGAVTVYRDSPIFANAFATLGAYPLLGVLAGAVVTALMQSSSASVGVLQTLAMNGIVSWKSAVFITLGQNIGTCVTALISSIGAHKTARRAAVLHLIFNVLGAGIFAVIMSFFFWIFRDVPAAPITSVQISIFHSIFNISCTILLLPFANRLVKLSKLFVKDRPEDEPEETDAELRLTLRHLDKRILGNAAFAIREASLEVVHMGQVTCDNTRLAFEAVLNNDENKAKTVMEREKNIDKMAHYISDYLVRINGGDLSEEQSNTITDLFYTVSDIERMGDHAEDLAELAMYKVENTMRFSKAAYEELSGLMELVTNSFEYSIRARESLDEECARKAISYEDMVDRVEEELRKKHMERLSKEMCKPTSGVTFLNILTNLERIADHADNVAGYVLNELG